jgi:hypothetical protein
MLTLSANGQNNGIVWGTAPLNGDANKHVVGGVVRAYEASDFDLGPSPGGPAKLRLLRQQAGFKCSKSCPPVVADGKLLVLTFDGLRTELSGAQRRTEALLRISPRTWRLVS